MNHKIYIAIHLVIDETMIRFQMNHENRGTFKKFKRKS